MAVILARDGFFRKLNKNGRLKLMVLMPLMVLNPPLALRSFLWVTERHVPFYHTFTYVIA